MRQCIYAASVLLILFIYSMPAHTQQQIETVTIGEQTWMKKNLNLDVLGSVCYENDSANCEKFGRLYFWHAAINVCPEGFRLPTDTDWTILTNYLGGEEGAGMKLMHNQATDFNALLGGNFQAELDMFSFQELRGYYWTASADSYNTAWIRLFEIGQESVKRTAIGKSFYFSVRCIKVD